LSANDQKRHLPVYPQDPQITKIASSHPSEKRVAIEELS